MQQLLQQQTKIRTATGCNHMATVADAHESHKGAAALLQTSAVDFISNENLQAEVFGPSSLIVLCRNENELLNALQSLHGQLTGTVIGLDEDIRQFEEAVSVLAGKVGRLLYNGVPTGVEVCHAMVHGGPFPATTNAGS